MPITPEILEIEKKLISIDSSIAYSKENSHRVEKRITKIELQQDMLNERMTTIKTKLEVLNEDLKELKENPFLAFTAELDIKKTIMIIITIVSIISSMSTLDFLQGTNNNTTQREILNKLEQIINE